MNDQTAHPAPPNPVAKLLDESGITVVGVVDDVFRGPSVADYKLSEFEEFWAEIEHDDAALAELSTFGISILRPDDIDNNVLRTLLGNRDQLQRLKPSFERYFAQTFDAKLKPVQDLCDCLEKQLGRTVVKRDGMADLNDPSIRLVFLDYFLEEGNETESIRAARRLADEIKLKYNKDQKPVVLLMSSKPSITPDMIASLRKGAGFVGSTFEYVSKQEFADTLKVIVTVGCVAKSIQERRQIQHFVEAVEDSISDATKKFRESLSDLSFEDYAYIQKLSLQREGHPLGDYVSWLFSAYFGHLLFDSIPEKETLDSLTFPKLPTASFEPSSQFTEIYKNIVTQPVGPVAGHPRDRKAADPDSPPFIHFGDIFTGDGTDILMVISPECDLAFTPDEQDRLFDPHRTVLLIPGTLSSEALPGGSSFKTDFFANRNDTNRITWHPKKVVSIPHGEIRTWLTTNGYGRSSRLRLPFALEVQQAFAADMSRMGMPVGPPVYRLATVQVACKNKDGQIHILETLPRAAFLFRTRGEEFVLSRGCIIQFGGIIDKAVAVLTEAREAHMAKGGSAQAHDQQMSVLLALKSSFTDLVELAGPFELPKAGGHSLGHLPLTVHKNHPMEGRYPSQKSLMLNIVDASVPPEAVEAKTTDS